jgi:hypothetical protein
MNMTSFDEKTERLTQAIIANKEPVFDALAAANITRVVIAFDGFGDQGQIESTEAFAADDTKVELPPGTVEQTYLDDGCVYSVEVDGKTVMRHRDGSTASVAVEGAIESLVYDALELRHGGWEINDGSFGEFIFDVAARSIKIEINERFSSSEYSEDEF